tara:strand:- start:75 stop:314 length:240 start_codon:yes stop_codon:yes gene_type:complete
VKLICLNVDECGHVEPITEEEAATPENFICRMCCFQALPYTNDYKPIIMEEEQIFQKKSEVLISSLYNLSLKEKPRGEK